MLVSVSWEDDKLPTDYTIDDIFEPSVLPILYALEEMSRRFPDAE
jgi:hypothetical protein